MSEPDNHRDQDHEKLAQVEKDIESARRSTTETQEEGLFDADTAKREAVTEGSNHTQELYESGDIHPEDDDPDIAP
jgi:hypothetical protein